jgi:hypothetical protein
VYAVGTVLDNWYVVPDAVLRRFLVEATTDVTPEWRVFDQRRVRTAPLRLVVKTDVVKPQPTPAPLVDIQQPPPLWAIPSLS